LAIMGEVAGSQLDADLFEIFKTVYMKTESTGNHGT